MTTLKDIAQSAREKLGTVQTSYPVGAHFKEHVTSEPFETTPVAGANGFDVTFGDRVQTAGFGVLGWREWTVTMRVRLGHGPFGTEREREDIVSEDVERVVDILEGHAWPEGTMLVLHVDTDTSKLSASWWVTTLFFRVVYVGELRS